MITVRVAIAALVRERFIEKIFLFLPGPLNFRFLPTLNGEFSAVLVLIFLLRDFFVP